MGTSSDEGSDLVQAVENPNLIGVTDIGEFGDDQ
jgi:hypothetical protein